MEFVNYTETKDDGSCPRINMTREHIVFTSARNMQHMRELKDSIPSQVLIFPFETFEEQDAMLKKMDESKIPDFIFATRENGYGFCFHRK